MAPGHGERLSQVIADAVTWADVRAVVQAGWAGLTGTGDRILAVGDLPHDWLFPQVAAVVHHAGAGTTGAGLRAGVPTVAVPMLADQPFWAHRLHRLGVAPEPVSFGELTAEALGGALRECLGEPSYRERVASLARRIADEDGAAAVLARIERLAALDVDGVPDHRICVPQLTDVKNPEPAPDGGYLKSSLSTPRLTRTSAAATVSPHSAHAVATEF